MIISIPWQTNKERGKKGETKKQKSVFKSSLDKYILLKITHKQFLGISERTVSLGPNQKLLNTFLRSSSAEIKLSLKSIQGFNSKEKIFLLVWFNITE